MTEKEDFVLTDKEGLFNPGKIKLTVILDNGDELISLLKKAQQQSTELSKTLQEIKKFNPVFHFEQ